MRWPFLDAYGRAIHIGSMLWLHIGTRKTGSTTLQSYLERNQSVLADRGLCYLRTGRSVSRKTGNPAYSHNRLAAQMRKGWPRKRQILQEFEHEVAGSPDSIHLISCEALYGQDLSSLGRVLLDRYPGEIRVLVYLRCWDSYLEALYKQALKLGLAEPDRDAFSMQTLARLQITLGHLDYAAELERIARALPRAKIVPRVYQTRDLSGGDIVADAMTAIGCHDVNGLQFAPPSNRTFSYAASRALGEIARDSGHPKPVQRQLFRKLYENDDPVLYGNGDVLSAPDRHRLRDIMAPVCERLRGWFPGREQLFDWQQAMPTRDAGAEARARLIVWEAYERLRGRA